MFPRAPLWLSTGLVSQIFSVPDSRFRCYFIIQVTPLRSPCCNHVTSQLCPVADADEDAIQSSERTSSPVIINSISSSSRRRGDVTDRGQSLPFAASSFSHVGLAPGTDFTAAAAAAWCLLTAATVPPRAISPSTGIPLFHSAPPLDHPQWRPAIDHQRRLTTADDSAVSAARLMTRPSTDHDRPPMLRPLGWPERRVTTAGELVTLHKPSRSIVPRLDLARSLAAADIVFSDAQTPPRHHLANLNADPSPASMWLSTSSLFVSSQQPHQPLAATPLTNPHRHRHGHHHNSYYHRYTGKQQFE